MPTATADRRWRSALALAFALALAGCDSRPPEPRLRDEGKSPQHLVMARLEIEHLIPKGRGGLTEEANLWLSCPLCNRAKAGRTTAIDPETGAEEPLFNPRTQRWSDHFAWSWDGLRIMGRTAIGRDGCAAATRQRPGRVARPQLLGAGRLASAGRGREGIGCGRRTVRG